MSGGSLRTPKGLKSAPGDLFTTVGFTKFPPRSRNGLGLIGSTSRDWGGGAGGTSVSDCGTFLGLLVFFDQLAALLTPSSAQVTPSPRRAGATKKNGLYFCPV